MARNPLAAEAVVCPSCGAKFSAGRDRCPRCRTRFEPTDPAAARAAAAATSRKLQVAGAALFAIALVGVGGVWLLAPRALSPVARPATVDPLSARRTPASRGAEPAKAGSAERPFMDAPGEAYEAYHEGDLEGALKHYQDAIAKNPNDAESLSNLGQVLVRLGRVNDSLQYFNRAIAANPDRWAYVFNRGRAEGLLGRWADCINDYRRAAQLFPDDYATTFNLAQALHKSGDDAAAIPEYQKAIDLSPDDATFRKALGTSFEKLDRKAEAAAAYQEYLRLAGDAPDADKVKERIALLTGAAATPAATEAAKLDR